MPEYLAPGVYVEEVEIGSKPIEGVGTSTAGFLGVTERGPTKPTLVTSFGQFLRTYGGFVPGSYMAHAVDGFFRNGGSRCFIGRITGLNARAATAVLGKKEDEYSRKYDVQAAVAVEVYDDLPEDFGGRDGLLTKVNASSQLVKVREEAGAYVFEATGVGTWGNSILLELTEASSGGDKKRLTVAYMQVADLEEPAPAGDGENGDDEGPAAGQPKAGKTYRLRKGTDGDALKVDSFKGSNTTGERTGLAAFDEIDEIAILYCPDIHMKSLTAQSRAAIAQALNGHCEQLGDRVVILDSEEGNRSPSDVIPAIGGKTRIDSKYAAFYYPWIKAFDPITNRMQSLPPGGHIAGIYARSDQTRGVHKAPANEVINGALDVEFNITKGEQDILNPRGVNCIRVMPGRGIRVWGARTTSSDPLWKYINVRRLFNFIEESIDEATQWVVFEPNSEKLWARVKQSVTEFLTRVWRDGALMGTKAEEAFFVKCDRSTMTQDDIDNGRLIVMIGVAPVKPAEFVIFRIAQWRGGSAVTE